MTEIKLTLVIESRPRLTPTDRLHMSVLAHMKLWPAWQVAQAYGVDRKTVYNAMQRYPQIIRNAG